jgi:hypothetical protein
LAAQPICDHYFVKTIQHLLRQPVLTQQIFIINIFLYIRWILCYRYSALSKPQTAGIVYVVSLNKQQVTCRPLLPVSTQVALVSEVVSRQTKASASAVQHSMANVVTIYVDKAKDESSLIVSSLLPTGSYSNDELILLPCACLRRVPRLSTRLLQQHSVEIGNGKALTRMRGVSQQPVNQTGQTVTMVERRRQF